MKRVRLVGAAVLVGSLLGGGALVHGASAAPVLQPGSSLLFGDSSCTMNWVYDGGGGPYVGAAGHCATGGVGQEVDLATGSGGAAIERIGRVSYISQGLDYCLIKVDGGVVGRLNPAMAGHPDIPRGVSTPSTAHPGDLVQFSGHGVGFDMLAVTQQQRVGVFNFFDGQGNQYVAGPVTPGDSGGPVADLTDGGGALGIVGSVGVTLALPLATAGEGGVAEYALLQDAAAHFASISLRTV